jgi:tyrosyl-tRNA synthetase
MSVVDLLVKAQMATSKNAARRLIKNGGARINDQKVTSDTVILSQQDFDEKGRLKLSSGKKNHVVLVLT